MNKNLSVLTLALCLGLLGLLTRCNTGPTEPPVPGTWSATYDLGTITFTIDESRTAIKSFNYSLEVTPACNPKMLSGKMTLNQRLNFEQGLKIIDSHFEIETNDISLDGKFNKSGTGVSGTWEFGTCKGKWEALKE